MFADSRASRRWSTGRTGPNRATLDPRMVRSSRRPTAFGGPHGGCHDARRPRRLATPSTLPRSKGEMSLLRSGSGTAPLGLRPSLGRASSFFLVAMAILGRWLEAHGFRVAILAQPDWKSADAWRAFASPRLFCCGERRQHGLDDQSLHGEQEAAQRRRLLAGVARSACARTARRRSTHSGVGRPSRACP